MTGLEHTLALVAAAGAAAFLAYFALSHLRLEVSHTNRLEEFSGHLKSGLTDRVGRTALRVSRADVQSWADNLEWAQLGGYYRGWTTATVAGQMIVYALAGLAAGVILQSVFLYGAAVILALLPYVQVRSRARTVQRRVVRAVPEMAALVAAELAAGNAPERGVERASELEGELGALLRRAVAESRASGKPLFSRPPVTGTLVAVLGGAGLESLSAFARQLDLVAVKGVGGAELMSGIARGLAREYYAHVLRAAEQLNNELLLPAALFFFLPFTVALMAPLVSAVLQIL